jgi:hypothetical protein
MLQEMLQASARMKKFHHQIQGSRLRDTWKSIGYVDLHAHPHSGGIFRNRPSHFVCIRRNLHAAQCTTAEADKMMRM